ncbi:MAG: LamG-like jellyroll fold domain-containing protein [Bryobacteraceae bacterium]|jgi:hypothetical protein
MRGSNLARLSPFLITAALLWSADPAAGPGIVARYSFVMNQPPRQVPSGTVVDGPILGNGDLGVVLAGPADEQRFYLGKNDFWSQQGVPMSVGGLVLRIPELAGAGYRQEQQLGTAEVLGEFRRGGLTVKTRSWTAEGENLLVTELDADGGTASVSARLFPEPTVLRDNSKSVNLGREQHGQGRWFFDGLLDEIRIYGRALSAEDIHALSGMREVSQGLVRRWDFDEQMGRTSIDTDIKVILGPDCKPPAPVERSTEAPADAPLGCMVDGYNPDYQRFGLGKRGRALKLMHEWEYADAGPVPPLQQVTVSAWIYVFKAGDANFILSKGDWNEAYGLSLDHGRLRFNVGDRFVRSSRALPNMEWVHVAGTFDGRVLRAYVNGEEVLPRPRILSGGVESGTLWLTRNADGPLDEQYAWPNPLSSARTEATRGREVSVATRVLGMDATVEGDALRFLLKPGAKAYIVTSVCSDLDAPQHLSAARSRASALTVAEVEKLSEAHREWWNRFWSESFVRIGDPLIEKFYYAAQYVIASSSRAGKVAPGLYGNWVTTDHPSWNGDYTLNYNHQTPFLALYSSNHIAISDSYDAPVLDALDRAKLYAWTLLGVRGAYYPGHLAPWGIERPFDYDPFMGQKSDASFLAIPMLMRFYSTYDLRYADRIYPFLREVGNFWEDYLKFENGKYMIYDDCPGEVGPWLGDWTYKRSSDWQVCPGNVNPTNEIGYLRAVFKGLIDISAELRTDEDRRSSWRHILEHLPPFEITERNGKPVLRLDSPIEWAAGAIWPAGQIGIDSDPKLREAALNALSAGGYNTHPLSAPALVRAGYSSAAILEGMRKHVGGDYPNGYVVWPGGGVETSSTVPGTINEMLLQSYEGVLRVFPAWPKDRDADFGNLRAYGAFLVSGAMVKGEVKELAIESEKGKDCTLENPWLTKTLTLSRNGRKAESLTGGKVTFKTAVGERISIQPR